MYHQTDNLKLAAYAVYLKLLMGQKDSHIHHSKGRTILLAVIVHR